MIVTKQLTVAIDFHSMKKKKYKIGWTLPIKLVSLLQNM